jgi:hypothetical protein
MLSQHFPGAIEQTTKIFCQNCQDPDPDSTPTSPGCETDDLTIGREFLSVLIEVLQEVAFSMSS